ncbi:MAG: UDP-N-acetylmuramoyl-L-alanine--D-glutamate ligase [Clostridia bacterium]|nr:UDP-N-acetylmuramoyl-L-alanine--D-glutamate ligase [Clostridia bacterium]
MKTLIVGSGKSGLAVADYLNARKIDYIFASENNIDLSKIKENELDEKLKGINQIITSPGIKINKKTIFQIKKRNIAFFNEFEFGVSKIKNTSIAVTGTNGKTTTVSLINFLLKDYDCGCEVGGNIGIPVTSLVDKLNGEEFVVLECSSFQLENINNFAPHISIILNIAQDHLDRHKTMKEYIRCKYNISKFQSKNDILLLNADDEYLYNNPPKTKAKILYFSLNKKIKGVYLKNRKVIYFDGIKEKVLCVLRNIKLRGNHNLSNMLASILAVYLITDNLNFILKLSKFEGVAHRIEFVKKIRGVEFYNDSKATNISSTLVACVSFKCSVNLILGGSDKGLDFDELFEKIPKNIKRIAVFGEIKNKIALSIKKYNFLNYYICDTLKECVDVLFDNSSSGEVILLSPACASFDQFSNYEERGNVFKKIVFELSEI